MRDELTDKKTKMTDTNYFLHDYYITFEQGGERNSNSLDR